jgi:hypothetical protein
MTVKSATAAAIGAVFAATAAMAGGPAVSKTNLKFTALGGTAEIANSSESAWSAIAALTAPLGEKWGLQIEAGAGGIDDDSSLGAAAHLFRRDPDKYLAGVFVSYANVDDADVSATRFGGEVEWYFEKVTLLAAAGYQTSDDLDDTAFGGIELRVYATDDLALSAGAAAQEDATYGRLGAEWRIAPGSLPGVALRAEAAIGEDDYSSVMGGLTVYFGEDATLKDRHRKQDPDSALFNMFQGLQARANAVTQLPPPVILD